MKIATKWIADDAVDKTKIAADVAGAGLVQAAGGELDVNPDDSTLEVSGDTLQVKDLGIDTAELAATAVTAAKLGADVAGNGLTGGSGSAVAAQADSTGGANLARAVNVSSNGIATKIDDDTIGENGSQQLYVKANSIGATEIDETDNYTWTGAMDMSGASSASVPTPTNDGHAATKGYVDSAIEGLHPKGRMNALADSNQTLSGLPSNIDGVTSWADSELVLCTGQTDASENGIWEVHSGAWTRPDNFAAGDGAAGASVFINDGTNYGNNTWRCTTNEPSDVIDTNDLNWEQHGGATDITFGTGGTKNGNDLRIGDGSTGDINGINRTADDIAAAVDDSSTAIVSNQIAVKDLGVATGKIAATAVTAAKLGADVAGDGLTGGNGSDLDVQADSTGGANLGTVVNVSSNGVAVKIDDSSIGENGSNQLEVKADGIDKTKLASDVAGIALTQAAGGEIGLDITSLDAETSNDDADLIAIYDDSGTAHKKMTRANFLSGQSAENIKHYLHKITSGETTAGYLTLSETPVNAQSVRASVVGGPPQVNKQVVGATGVTPDFDVLSSTQLHFNNNGAATGLSEELTTDDVLIIELQY